MSRGNYLLGTVCALESALSEVRAIHMPHDYRAGDHRVCLACGDPWPCRTYTAAIGEPWMQWRGEP